VNVEFVTRARIGLPTGTVIVTLDEQRNATYELVRPAAWDEIRVPAKALDAVSKARAFIYGSLAGRSPYNLEQLDRLLDVTGPMKFFDVNLRPPFVDPQMVMDLARSADVLKLNDGEVGQLAHWVRTGKSIPDTPRDDASIARDCQTLAEATGVSCVCVTRAEEGAALWDRGSLTTATVAARRGERHGRRRRCVHGRTYGRAHARNRSPACFGNRLSARRICRVALWRDPVAAAGIDAVASLILPNSDS
jgi:sugar/nucleoside kinase (ribokinase family)